MQKYCVWEGLKFYFNTIITFLALHNIFWILGVLCCKWRSEMYVQINSILAPKNLTEQKKMIKKIYNLSKNYFDIFLKKKVACIMSSLLNKIFIKIDAVKCQTFRYEILFKICIITFSHLNRYKIRCCVVIHFTTSIINYTF